MKTLKISRKWAKNIVLSKIKLGSNYSGLREEYKKDLKIFHLEFLKYLYLIFLLHFYLNILRSFSGIFGKLNCFAYTFKLFIPSSVCSGVVTGQSEPKKLYLKLPIH